MRASPKSFHDFWDTPIFGEHLKFPKKRTRKDESFIKTQEM